MKFFNAALTVAALALASGAARAAPATIVVKDAWSRPASDTAVVYAVFQNRSAFPDRLIGATSPAATHVGLHESTESKMGGMSMSMGTMQMGGSVMSMKAVPSIPVPAEGTARLQPGGYHLMVDLRRPIQGGQTIPLRLHFARAGWIDTTVSVRPIR